MRLQIGPIALDTKGLPRISSVGFYPELRCVDVYLVGSERRAVQRWARRLGVAVTEDPAPAGDWRYASAVLEMDGFRLEVHAYVLGDQPAPPPTHALADPPF